MTIIDLMNQSGLEEIEGSSLGVKETINTKIGRVNEHLSSKTINLTIHKEKKPISSTPNQKYIEKIFNNHNKTIMTMSSHPYFRPNSKSEKIVPRIVPRIHEKLVINLSEDYSKPNTNLLKTSRLKSTSKPLRNHPHHLNRTV